MSFAAKAADKRIPLWVLFLAAQLVDVVWAVLVFVGVEKLRIVPGITASNELDLYYMPYTHGLATAFIWSVAAALGYTLLGRTQGGRRAGLIVGLTVFSHWVLDWLVHRPDLPLYDDTFKVGLALWDRPAVAFALEASLLLGGLLLYLRSTSPVGTAGCYGMPAFAVVLLLVQVSWYTGAAPSSPGVVAMSGLVTFAAFAGVVAWLEKKRL